MIRKRGAPFGGEVGSHFEEGDGGGGSDGRGADLMTERHGCQDMLD